MGQEESCGYLLFRENHESSKNPPFIVTKTKPAGASCFDRQEQLYKVWNRKTRIILPCVNIRNISSLPEKQRSRSLFPVLPDWLLLTLKKSGKLPCMTNWIWICWGMNGLLFSFYEWYGRNLCIFDQSDLFHVVFIQGFELALRLQHQAGRDLTASDGRHKTFQIRNLPNICRLVDQAAHMDGKPAPIHIIGNCDASLFLGGKEETTLKSWNSLLGKETIDLYNTSVTKGNQESHGQNFQKSGKPDLRLWLHNYGIVHRDASASG